MYLLNEFLLISDDLFILKRGHVLLNSLATRVKLILLVFVRRNSEQLQIQVLVFENVIFVFLFFLFKRQLH